MGAEQSVPAAAAAPAAAGGAAASAAPATPSHTSTAAAAADASGSAGSNKPKALVVVGPSGVGKGTLIARLLASDPGRYWYSVSTTTRAPRPGEKDGEHYEFAQRDAMLSATAAGEFLEWAEVHGALYGTRRAPIAAAVAAGKVPVLDIDVQGARAARAAGLDALYVFIAPPSLEELERRLRGRRTEGAPALARRLGAAKGEIGSLNERGLYDYLLINDSLDETAARLARIGARAAAGLPAEPGFVPERVVLEDDEEEGGGGGEGSAVAEGQAAGGGDDEAAAHASAVATDGGTVASALAGAPAAAAAAAAGTAAAGVPAANGTAAGDGSKAAAITSEPEQQQQQEQQEQQQEQQQQQQQQPPQQPPQPQQQPPHQEPQQPSAAEMAAGLERWRGRVALVTGASSGIGWAVCEALGRAGLRVVAAARRRERLEALQRRMTAARSSGGVGVSPADFLPVVCDVTKEAEVQALPRIIQKRWGAGRGIDVLVSNAGLSRNDASLFDGNTSSWIEMASTNLLGSAMLAREAARDMKRRGEWGHIFMMVGLSGHRIPDAAAGGSFFCATKFGVRALTDGLRQEARAARVPLRVTGISPGLVATEFFQVRAFGDGGAAAAAMGGVTPLEPADIARSILWALSAPAHMEVNDIVVRPRDQTI